MKLGAGTTLQYVPNKSRLRPLAGGRVKWTCNPPAHTHTPEAGCGCARPSCRRACASRRTGASSPTCSRSWGAGSTCRTRSGCSARPPSRASCASRSTPPASRRTRTRGISCSPRPAWCGQQRGEQASERVAVGAKGKKVTGYVLHTLHVSWRGGANGPVVVGVLALPAALNVRSVGWSRKKQKTTVARHRGGAVNPRRGGGVTRT